MKSNLYIIVVVWWTLWISVHVWMLSSYGFPLDIAAADGIISNVILALFCAATGFMVRNYRPSPQKGVYLLLGVAVAAAVNTWGSIQILKEIFPDDFIYGYFLKNSILPRYVLALLMLALSLAFGWVYHISHEMKEEKIRMTEMSRLAKDAELSMLIQKIQPHFLFNTLNSVNSLVKSNPDAARQMIQQLSDFLRGSLRQDSTSVNHLSDEFHQLELYFGIEKIRFGNRLNTELTATDDALMTSIPSLLLQPLVENAIKFGLYDTLGTVTIKIHAEVKHHYLVITVTNPYDKDSSKAAHGTGFGLSALSKRLYLLYGRNDLFESEITDDTYTARLKIPVE